MKTKQQVQKKLRELYPEARLVVNMMAYRDWDIEIEAPPNHHWDDGPHTRVVCRPKQGDKRDFWQDVFDEIDGLTAEPCDGKNCGSSCDNVCQYWRIKSV